MKGPHKKQASRQLSVRISRAHSPSAVLASKRWLPRAALLSSFQRRQFLARFCRRQVQHDRYTRNTNH